MVNSLLYKNIILFGTDFGINQSLTFFPRKNVVAIVAPSIKPEQTKKVKIIADEHGIKCIIQPLKKSDEFEKFYEEIKELNPDLILCNSYSMIIPKVILEIVNYKAINIHWALLPLNRGPNPIQWSIIKGEKKTGVTIHLMDSGMDTGDILFQEEIEISIEDTWMTLFEKLEKLSNNMLKEYIPLILNNAYTSWKQNEIYSSTNFRLTCDYPVINFDKQSNMEIYNLIRAQVAPLNGAYIINESNSRIYFKERLSIQKIEELRRQYGV